jgi:hypothetical protein
MKPNRAVDAYMMGTNSSNRTNASFGWMLERPSER